MRYMLFTRETRLEAPVQGTSTFSKEFAAAGPKDSTGRSLRDLDLNRRMFRYPCSFLIYSERGDHSQIPPTANSFERILISSEPFNWRLR